MKISYANHVIRDDFFDIVRSMALKILLKFLTTYGLHLRMSSTAEGGKQTRESSR